MGNYASYTDGNPPADTDVFLISRNGTGTRRYTYLQLRTALAALFEAAGAVAAHEAAGNPHPTYLTQAEADALYDALGGLAAHVAAGDPHTQYALDSALGTIASQNANNVAITGGAVSDVDLNLKDETVAADGDLAYNATTEELNYYNGQRALTDAVGWTPHASPIWSNGNGPNTLNLLNVSAGNGGAVAIPVLVQGHMLFETLTLRQTSTANLRTAEWRIYRQRLNNGNSGENTLNEVSGANGTFSFTPTGASNVSSSVSSPPVYLAPGCYWLVLRNTSTAEWFQVSVAAAAALAPNLMQTKDIAALGSTIDLVAATWTKSTSVPNLILKGRVFGETTVF